MQNSVEIGQIKDRVSGLNLNLKRFAQHAGVHYSTLYRLAAADADPKLRTAGDVMRALARLEREMLIRLAGLHPDLIAELAAAQGRQEAAE